MADEEITPKFWSGLKVVYAVSSAVVIILVGVDKIVQIRNEPVVEMMIRIEKRQDVFEKRQDGFDKRQNDQDNLLAIVKKRTQINSACENGAIGLLNRKFNVNLMSPYDLFEKPEDLEVPTGKR